MTGGFLTVYTLQDGIRGSNAGSEYQADYSAYDYDAYGGDYGDYEAYDKTGGDYPSDGKGGKGGGDDYDGDYKDGGSDYEYEDYGKGGGGRDRKRRQVQQATLDDLKSGDIVGTVIVNETIGGGGQTDRSWLFSGEEWHEVKAAPVGRDRPACSIVNMPDGKVCIILLSSASNC